VLQRLSHPVTRDARHAGLGALRSVDQLYLACGFMKLEVKDYSAGDLTNLNLRSKLEIK